MPKQKSKLDEILEPLIKNLVFKKTITESDLNTVIDITIKNVVESIGAQSITVYLIGKDDLIYFSYVYFSDTLYKDDPKLKEAFDKKTELLKNMTLKRGQGVVGKVIASKDSYICVDADKDPDFYQTVDKEIGYKTRTMITVPFMVDNNAIGAIQVINKGSNDYFTKEDKLFLEHVANYSAKIIQKVYFPEVEFSEQELASYIAQLAKYPYLALDDKFEYDEQVLDSIDIEILKKYAILPIKKHGLHSLDVVLSNPFDLQTIEAFEYSSKMKIKSITISAQGDIVEVLNRYLKQHNAQFAASEMSDVAAKLDESLEEDVQTISIDTNDVVDEQSAPIVQLANQIIEDAFHKGASDIHIEPFETQVIVRYRIDGVLHEQLKLPINAINALIARYKIMSSLNITEKRVPQDGRIKFKNYTKKDVDIELRVSTAPLVFGEKIVMRILNKTSTLLGLEVMGFSEHNLKTYREILSQPYGMILHVGPTGSGKTTTLYSALNELNSPDVNIQTAEDPVEYMIQGINQMQMQSKVGLTFAAALRCFLRQDPDIIMVGEIRDRETAETAIEASLTGHLVISTLHTNDAATTVTRFIDMGIEPFLVSSSLLGVCAQRLVRKLCPDCKKEYTLSDAECKNLGLSKGAKMFKPVGCKKCHDLGYKGRIGVHELLTLNDEMRVLINERKSADIINAAAVKNGLIPLFRDGLEKAVKGITSLEEVFANLRK
ncbi:MAG: GspE/PulE family protein [Elusimicrobiota bacterium]